MIEFAILDNGPTDLPIKRLPEGGLVPDGDLEAMHRSMQRTVVAQIRNAIFAEQAGFHYYFFTEHHFQPEGNEFSPNPLLLGAAIATRTSHLRLGQMANIVSWWHPIRLAEQAAMLDVISGGRLEFGVGRGLQPRETGIFAPYYGSSSTDEIRSLQYFEEAVEVILKAWTQPSFSHHGEFFSFPPPYVAHHHQSTIDYFSQPGVGRTPDQVLAIGEKTPNPVGIYSHLTTMKELQVFPRPLQSPHPQLWQPVVMSERSLRRAARLGMNAFIIGSSMEQIRNDVAAYMQAADSLGWPDRLDRGAFNFGWDCRHKRGLGHVQQVHLVGKGMGNPDKFRRGGKSVALYLSNYLPANLGSQLFSQLFSPQDSHEPSFIGSSQQVIDSFMQLKERGGYDDFLCAVGFRVPGMSGEEVHEQIQSFSEEVMPELVRACGGAAPFEPADPEMAI